MDELKPCLCGSDKVHFGYEPFCGLTFWRVMCDTCGTQTSTFDTKEEAAKVWNTRPAEEALKAEMERLKSRWEKLKDFCEGEEYCSSMFSSGAYKNVLNKIKELGKDTDAPTKESEGGDE